VKQLGNKKKAKKENVLYEPNETRMPKLQKLVREKSEEHQTRKEIYNNRKV